LVIESGKDKNCQYNETIFTQHALGTQYTKKWVNIPEHTRVSLSLCKRKVASAKEKKG